MKLIFAFRRLILLLLSCSLVQASANELLTLSDIHFNPFESCTFSLDSHSVCPLIQALNAAPAESWRSILQKDDKSPIAPSGQETHIALFEATLHFAQSQFHPSFIFLGGDYLGHGYQENYRWYSKDASKAGYENFVKKTLTFLFSEIHDTFPKVPTFFTIGNNDSYFGDYISDPNGPFYQDIQTLALPFHGGEYYVASLAPQHELVILDSVLFSAKGSVPASNSVSLPEAAKQELFRLAGTLQEAEKNHTQVWILMHIPDVVDPYASKKAGHPIELWDAQSDQIFRALLKQYAQTVTLIFSGHFHTDGSFIYPSGLVDTYLPGLDSTHGNPPEFKVYDFDPQSFAIHSMSLYEFKQGRFQLHRPPGS